MTVPPEQLADLAAIVEALLSPANDVRKAAESALQASWRDSRPDALLTGLAELIRSSPVVTVRAGCVYVLVLFKKSFKKLKKQSVSGCVAIYVYGVRLWGGNH